jgi:hypothetical protein
MLRIELATVTMQLILKSTTAAAVVTATATAVTTTLPVPTELITIPDLLENEITIIGLALLALLAIQVLKVAIPEFYMFSVLIPLWWLISSELTRESVAKLQNRAKRA